MITEESVKASIRYMLHHLRTCLGFCVYKLLTFDSAHGFGTIESTISLTHWILLFFSN